MWISDYTRILTPWQKISNINKYKRKQAIQINLQVQTYVLQASKHEHPLSYFLLSL